MPANHNLRCKGLFIFLHEVFISGVGTTSAEYTKLHKIILGIILYHIE